MKRTYGDRLSIMEHQLQEALGRNDREPIVAYAKQLNNFLTLMIEELTKEQS